MQPMVIKHVAADTKQSRIYILGIEKCSVQMMLSNRYTFYFYWYFYIKRITRYWHVCIQHKKLNLCTYEADKSFHWVETYFMYEIQLEMEFHRCTSGQRHCLSESYRSWHNKALQMSIWQAVLLNVAR